MFNVNLGFGLVELSLVFNFLFFKSMLIRLDSFNTLNNLIVVAYFCCVLKSKKLNREFSSLYCFIF